MLPNQSPTEIDMRQVRFPAFHSPFAAAAHCVLPQNPRSVRRKSKGLELFNVTEEQLPQPTRKDSCRRDGKSGQDV
jgi:hypothetical protein